MGRKPIHRKAMTAVERQRRRRKKLQRLKRQAEMAEKREKNRRRFLRPRPAGLTPGQQADQLAREVVWKTLYWQPPLPGANEPADELVRQIAEWLALEPSITVDDVRAALDRRFPRAQAELPDEEVRP